MLVAMWAFLSGNVCVYIYIYIYIYKPVLYVHGLQGGPMASYSQPFELYDVDVVDVVFTLLCHTSTNVIDFLFLCAIQNRRPPIQHFFKYRYIDIKTNTLTPNIIIYT